MGVCHCVADPCTLELKQQVKTCIENEDLRKLEKSFKKLLQKLCIGIDAPIYLERNISMNLLGYALFCGKLKAFVFIKDTMKAIPDLMESNFSAQRTSGVEILTEMNNLTFLDYYLPIYLALDKEILDESLYIMPKYNKIKGKSAIFIACVNSNIQALEYFKNYFENELPPPELNINFVDPYTGENCAFIACKNADLAMLKYLFEKTELNFFQVNKKGHSCLNAAVLECGLGDHLPYQIIIRFLVLCVKMDPHFNTEAYRNQAINTDILDFLSNFEINN